MSKVYSDLQVDKIVEAICTRVELRISPSRLQTEISNLIDTNFMTDAEKVKLSELEVISQNLVQIYESAKA